MILIGLNAVVAICIAAACGAAAAGLIVYVATKNNPNTKTNVLAAGIRTNALQFSGMYEPMFAVSVGKSGAQREVFSAWNERVYACDEDNGFKAIYTEKFGDYQGWGRKGNKINPKKANKIYTKKARKLVKIIEKAGVIRDKDTFVVGSPTNARCYENVTGAPILPGRTYEVLSPYWHQGEDVLDRGAVR